MERFFPTNRPHRAKLIFNPISGAPGDSPAQLLAIVAELQAGGYLPEVFLVQPESDVTGAVKDALRRGIRTFVVSGGDGTIDTVAGALAGSSATLGIVPTGTQNNVALSLGIPSDIPSAIGLLRNGRRVKVDVGVASIGEVSRPFLEICSVGLLSALFPAADDIQHGNLARVGDLLATLVSFPPAEMHLVLDAHHEFTTQGHIVLVGNMPYVGPHYQIAPKESFVDGLLDVLVFANLSKLDLIGTVVTTPGVPVDPRIQRYQVRSVLIETSPSMPVLVDGFTLGEGPLHISVRRRALSIITGKVGGSEPAVEAETTV